jgi:Protein of unknown function DUF58
VARLLFLRKVTSRARRVWGWFPVRLPGLALAAAGTAVAWWVGKERVDYLLYPAGLAAAGLVGVAALGVLAAAFVLWRSLRQLPAGLPDALETTHATKTAFRFRRLRAWPLVEVRMAWESPTEVAVALVADGAAYEEVVTPRARGRHPEVTRRFVVEDIFGLCSFTFRRTWVTPIRILPAMAVAGAELAAAHSHGDAFSHPSGRAEGDLVEMRRYAHGDSMRHILWKTFARTRRLLVRMPERALAPKPITVAFLVAGAEDDATAATARLYLERGLFGPDFVFSADGAAKPTSQPHEAIDQIVDSGSQRDHGGHSLEALAAQVEAARLTSCVVFVPPVDGPWRERVTAFTRRLPAAPTVVIGVEGSLETHRPGLLRRVFLRPDEPPNPVGAALPKLRAALEADGLRVQVLHRTSGALL